jgi:peptidoglycan/LPS O-acetylase OafA/YrhL
VLAAWVALGHFGPPIVLDANQGGIVWIVRAFLNLVFSGPAAVIIFFVISGFCIHFPNRNGLEVKVWKMYYARRYLRTLIPMAIAVALALPLKMQLGIFSVSILWSLVCEEVYYFIYPMLLILHRRIGWSRMIVIAWGLAMLTALTRPGQIQYPSYGPGLNWVLGLPCWLLGCKLAEKFGVLDPTPVSPVEIWSWRSGAWAVSVLLGALAFHTPLGYPWTLNFFAAYGFLWLEREIRYYRARPQTPLFESLGEASYSIYLTHTHGIALLAVLPMAAALSPLASWFWKVVLGIAFAAAFYWAVERPSHRFARLFAQRAPWLHPPRSPLAR